MEVNSKGKNIFVFAIFYQNVITYTASFSWLIADLRWVEKLYFNVFAKECKVSQGNAKVFEFLSHLIFSFFIGILRLPFGYVKMI